MPSDAADALFMRYAQSVGANTLPHQRELLCNVLLDLVENGCSAANDMNREVRFGGRDVSLRGLGIALGGKIRYWARRYTRLTINILKENPVLAARFASNRNWVGSTHLNFDFVDPRELTAGERIEYTARTNIVLEGAQGNTNRLIEEAMTPASTSASPSHYQNPSPF
jgi:hypothetical protein